MPIRGTTQIVESRKIRVDTASKTRIEFTALPHASDSSALGTSRNAVVQESIADGVMNISVFTMQWSPESA